MPAQVCFTLDNLGDAADLYRGIISQPRPAGHNPALESGVPALLDLLAEFAVQGTYFVEGWSARQYPQMLEQITSHGHEVGMHGWQHEQWSTLSPSQIDELIALASQELTNRLGKNPEIFRAPGGISNAHTRTCLYQLGYRIDASLAEFPQVHRDQSGLVLVPYQWSGVDATHWLWSQKTHDAVFKAWADTLDHAAANNEHIVFIWHPHVMGIDPQRLAVGRKILALVLDDPRFEVSTLTKLGEQPLP